MKLRALIDQPPVKITPMTTLEQASLVMRKNDLRILPVWDRGELVGIVTAWDIVSRGIAEGKDSWFTSVADVMTRDVLTCDETCDVEEAREYMHSHDLSVLPVVDRSGDLLGMVSREDLSPDRLKRTITSDGSGLIIEATTPAVR